MARIPDDPEGFGNLRGLFGDRPVAATGDDFGAGVGRSIEGLGDALGGIAEREIERKKKEEKEKEAKAKDEEKDDKEPKPPEQPKPPKPEEEKDFFVDFEEKNRRVQGAEDGLVDVFLRGELDRRGRATRVALERQMSAADTDFAPKFRQGLTRDRRAVFADLDRRFRPAPEMRRLLEDIADGEERRILARTMVGAHNARVLRLVGMIDGRVDALAADVRSGEMELEPALAVLTDLAAVRGEVVPDGDGAFAAEQTRRLFMELGEGLPERDALAAPELIDGGMLAGGGLTREEIAALRANAERAKARSEATSAGEIEDQIQAGSAGVLEVEAARRSGQIPESAAARLTGMAENVAAGREKAAMGATRIADVMLGRGEAGDPADAETRAAVEAFTESTLPDPMAMVPAETAARIVQQTGILPSRVAVSLKAGLAEGADPARRNEALVTYMLLKGQSPGVLEAELEHLRAADPLKPLTTARDLATYDVAGSFVGAGIEPDEAFRLAQAETEAQVQPASFVMPVPRPGGSALPGQLPPPVPPEAIDKLAKEFPKIPIGELNRILGALFREFFVLGRPLPTPAGEDDGEEEEGRKRPQLPTPSGESTADQPPQEPPPTPPDPTLVLPTPEELAKARRKAIEKGGGKLVEVTRPERRAFPDAGTELNLREGEIVAADVARTGRPLGFKNVGGVDEFRQFKDRLLAAVPKGLTDVQIGIRGSSIHGNAFNRQTGIHDGEFFDTKRRPDGSIKRSDRDLFIVSPELAKRAEELGFLKPGQGFAQLTARKLRTLGLKRLADLVEEKTDRRISFRLFKSKGALKRETSYIIFTQRQ